MADDQINDDFIITHQLLSNSFPLIYYMESISIPLLQLMNISTRQTVSYNKIWYNYGRLCWGNNMIVRAWYNAGLTVIISEYHYFFIVSPHFSWKDALFSRKLWKHFAPPSSSSTYQFNDWKLHSLKLHRAGHARNEFECVSVCVCVCVRVVHFDCSRDHLIRHAQTYFNCV